MPAAAVGELGNSPHMSISPIASSHRSVPLDAFTRAAERGGDIYLDAAGDELRVLPAEAAPDARRAVPATPGGDASSAFMQALARAYGAPVARAVESQVGLAPAPGKPLPASVVEQAIAMAQAGRQALLGVDFVTALALSARSEGAAFCAACRELGIDPKDLDEARRRDIDQAMRERFQEAAADGRSPVDPAAARGWLDDVLRGPAP